MSSTLRRRIMDAIDEVRHRGTPDRALPGAPGLVERLARHTFADPTEQLVADLLATMVGGDATYSTAVTIDGVVMAAAGHAGADLDATAVRSRVGRLVTDGLYATQLHDPRVATHRRATVLLHPPRRPRLHRTAHTSSRIVCCACAATHPIVDGRPPAELVRVDRRLPGSDPAAPPPLPTGEAVTVGWACAQVACIAHLLTSSAALEARDTAAGHFSLRGCDRRGPGPRKRWCCPSCDSFARAEMVPPGWYETSVWSPGGNWRWLDKACTAVCTLRHVTSRLQERERTAA